MIKLSVVIPVFKAEKYIENTLLLLYRENSELEFVLIDDCSPDKSGAICDKLCATFKNVNVLHKEVNEGLSMARNSGIMMAQGQYVMFVDADDSFAEKDALEIVLSTLSSEKDIYFLNMDRLYPDGKRTTVNNFDGKIKGIESEAEICDILAQEKAVPASASLKIIRREKLIENKLFFKKGIFCEDIEWFFRLFQSGILARCGYIPITYLYYQGNNNSITKNISYKNWVDLYEIVKNNQIFNCQESNIYENHIRKMLAFETMMLVYMLTAIEEKYRQEATLKIKDVLTNMKSAKDIRVKLSYYVSKLFGVRVASKLLRIAQGAK